MNNGNKDKEAEGWTVFLPKEKKELKLDKKDQLILQTLTENCRTSLATLKSITNLSKASIINRINNLETIGELMGYHTLINIHKLGIRMFTIGVKTNMTLKQREDYVRYLKSIQFLNQVVTFFSERWDFMIRVYVKDNKQLDELLTKITDFPKIKSIDVMLLDDWFYKPTNYFGINVNLSKKCKRIDFSFQKILEMKKEKNKVKFDGKDIEILEIMANNSRIPIIKIAEQVGLSADTVSYRIKAMIKQGIIEGFFAALNPYFLGFTAYMVNLQVFNRTKISEIISYINHNSRCTGILKYLEGWNIAAAVLVKDVTELRNFEEELLKKFESFIHEYEIIQIREQPYYDFFPKEIRKILLHETFL